MPSAFKGSKGCAFKDSKLFKCSIVQMFKGSKLFKVVQSFAFKGSNASRSKVQLKPILVYD